jgi:hypothetical protein
MLGGGLATTALGGVLVADSRSGHAPTRSPLASATLGHDLRRSRFTPALGASFLARGEHGTFRLRLAEILDLPRAPVADEHSFNLLFHAPRHAPPEGIYRLSSRHTGQHTLFLSAIGQSGRTMQGLVNRSS